MKTDICLRKLSGLVVEVGTESNEMLAFSLNAELMRLGFIISEDLVKGISKLSVDKICSLSAECIDSIKKMVGADVDYTPMYPNFPQGVMEMSEWELYVNAMLHYWSRGEWKPSSHKLPRKFDLSEFTKFKTITLLKEEQFINLFPTLLSSNDSLSSGDKEIVEHFLNTYKDLPYPKDIPYKETVCLLAGRLVRRGDDISHLVKTATDILRVVTYINDGDISLAGNTKFKSLPRSIRKQLIKTLEVVATEEDIQRHRNKWNKLFHNLHVGDYSEKLYLMAHKVRNNVKIKTFNSKIQALIDGGSFSGAANKLKERPGDFARRLDHLLRNDESGKVVDDFIDVIPSVSTRVLMQLLGHFKGRNALGKRVVFPKGNTQKAVLIPEIPGTISENNSKTAVYYMVEGLLSKFSGLKPLGKVWIDPWLKKCPLPAQQRSVSKGIDTVARGTRLPIENNSVNTLRFFIYWVGQDIDLSATLHDSNFKMVERIAYTNLKSKKYQACHSGDIVQAPTGASEFIDITMDQAYEHGIRYVVMNVFVFAGPNFNEHTKCYAGWMGRAKPRSNEIYDPKTVASKMDLTCASRNAVPVVFDLKHREAIWCDLITSSLNHWGGNNVESNKAGIEDVLRAITMLDNKPTLFDLAALHAKARGSIVDKEEDADFTFGISKNSNVCPTDINVINSELLI
ncbi:MAG: hypothetical protein E3J47_08210 [Candidatus Stahlbacteria bacterium]|nr:MAG: hypothetical protein E3J47_08210 [Candidatus Stahlbacteria bacterium]